MKKAIRLLSVITALSLVLIIFAACSEKSNTLDGDIYAMAQTITSKLDFGDAHILSDKDDGAEFALMFQYGVEDDSVLDAISAYVITAPEANSAKTVAIITFKEGTDASVIEGVKQTITDVYLANLIETTATYNVDEAKIADNATFKLYDNALVLAAYDTEGNSQVFDLLK